MKEETGMLVLIYGRRNKMMLIGDTTWRLSHLIELT